MATKDPARRRWHLSTPAIAGLVALVSGVVTLVFTLSPSLKPDPGNAISAKLTVLSVEPHASYASYTGRLGDLKPDAASGLSAEKDGAIVYLQIEVNGRKRHGLEMRDAIYLHGSGRRYRALPPELEFQSQTPSDRWVAALYVVNPGLHRKFFVRYELVDRDVILAVAKTPPIHLTPPS